MAEFVEIFSVQAQHEDPVVRPIKHVVLPLVAYSIAFSLLRLPWLLQFSTHFWCDFGDGLQNVWNLWWINKAVTELRQSPWHTQYLDYPYGFSLHGTTLNPFNGFFAIPLLSFLTLVQTYNTIVFFSFVASGLSAFLLCFDRTRAYLGSLLGGYIFAFSHYHFAHALGHLQLVSTEWLPLFLLAWFRLLERPRHLTALIAALFLFLTYLCDYYYFTYACMTAGLAAAAWRFPVIRLSPTRKGRLSVIFTFLAAVLVTVGPLAVSFLTTNLADPFVGAHPPEKFSLDLLGVFVPDGVWRFGWLTRPIWSRFSGNIAENGTYLGWSVLAILCFTWRQRARLELSHAGFWYLVLFTFWALALGPSLHVAGKIIPLVPLPYRLVHVFVPLASLSGMPVRMVVMVTLAAAVLCAAGFGQLAKTTRRPRVVLWALMGVCAIEYFPTVPQASAPYAVDYVEFLRQARGAGAVLDASSLRTPQALFLYYQTIHGKPLAFGYTARTTRSIEERRKTVESLIRESRFDRLHDAYGVRWVISDGDLRLDAPFATTAIPNSIQRGRIYDLGAVTITNPPS